ncbi:MAG: PAS domain S-box protein [Anaerolineales bacterium]|nr:PAS domain S-box protein [Anaerolineales bacterium]
MTRKTFNPQLYQQIRDIRLRLFEFANNHSLEELLIRTLDEAELLTDSAIGFFHFLEEDQETLSLQAWSTQTADKFCQALGAGLHYSVENAGVWADCVREKKPLIHNDVPSLPNRKGMPDGHAEVIRELVVPVLRQDHIVAILGVGNKKTDYQQVDLEAVSYLADICWEIAEKKRAEETLQQRTLELQRRVQELRCLHGLSRLKEKQDLTREQLLQSAVELLPPAWLHSETICARISLHDQVYTTVNFKETPQQQSVVILINSQPAGSVDVFSLEELPDGQSSFRKQEQGLLNAFAESLGFFFERKGAQTALQEREHYLQKILDTTMDGFWVLDASGFVVEVNQAYCSMSGYTRDEIIGLSIEDLNAEEATEFIEARIQRVIKHGEMLFEARHRRKDGSIWDVEVSANWLDEQGGQFICFGRDLTERKKLEKALLDEHQRQVFILDGSRAGTWEWNLQTNKTTFNKTWAEMLGYTLDELSPTTFETWKSLTDPDSFAISMERIERYLAGETSDYECELRMRHKDGHWIWVLDRGRVMVHDAGGKPLLMFGTHSDITQRKRAEEKHQALQEQLIQTQKLESVGRLAGGIAHDFNNMLGVMLGHMEIAIEQTEPDSPVRSHLEEAHRAAKRSAGLTRQLLTFARKQTVLPRVLDINETVEGMLDLLQRLIGEDIDLVWHPGHPGMIRIDPSQVDQILTNLCVNARYAIQGQGKITIKTSLAVLDDTLLTQHPDLTPAEYTLLVVSDDGDGMDEETLKTIFEPFFTTKDIGEGIGLGLATVYGIVKQNNGLINVDSEPGQGTTFNIYLPVHSGEPPRTKIAEKPSAASVQHNGTILLVEDEPAVLEVTRFLLEQMGLSVLSASSPEEGLSLAASHPEEIALLITDVIMPGMNGRDLAERLCTHQPNLKTLFISGYTADIISQRGELEDGVQFLQKPYSSAALQERIREILFSTGPQD